jgi:hypothetical protein
MTISLGFLLQVALTSAAAIDKTVFHHVRQLPAQAPSSTPLTGLLGKGLPPGFKPPPGLPLPPFLLAAPTPVKVTSTIERPATIRPEGKRIRVSYGPFDLLAKDVSICVNWRDFFH